VADAVAVYQHAVSLSSASDTVREKLATAQAQRQLRLSQCQNGSGTPALQACEAALLHGAEDEFEIDKREGILLQSVNEPEQALDAYVAASVLKQDDQTVALAIVALTRSTGRKDALALQALGSALLTLGRPSDAAAVLTEARGLTPTLPGIAAQIERAQRLAHEPQRSASTSDVALAAATSTTLATPAKPGTTAAQSPARAPAKVASAAPPPQAPARTYSNDAPDGQSN
jgi:tetratricopeptide (TPR) repeat protein